MKLNVEQIIDILDKMDFFGGQRAGRELWNDKPIDVQEEDLANFSRDVALVKEYIEQLSEDNKGLIINMNAFGMAAKRLGEENEKLTKALDSKCDDCIARERANTVREMQAEIINRCIKGGIYPAFVATTIDKIAKEMIDNVGT